MLPHWHVPATHALDVVGLQLLHWPPPAPQAVIPGVTQLCPEQHPVGHDVASQMQLPPEHRWPGRHAVPRLHVHCPAAEQPSPLEPHTVHAPPPVPQLSGPCAMHTLFSQQPLGQDAALHTHFPPTHARFWPQAFPCRMRTSRRSWSTRRR